MDLPALPVDSIINQHPEDHIFQDGITGGFDGDASGTQGQDCNCNHGVRTNSSGCSCDCDTGWRTLPPNEQPHDNWEWCTIEGSHHSRPDLDGNGTITIDAQSGGLDHNVALIMLLGIIILLCVSCCWCTCCRNGCGQKGTLEARVMAKLLRQQPHIDLAPQYSPPVPSPRAHHLVDVGTSDVTDRLVDQRAVSPPILPKQPARLNCSDPVVVGGSDLVGERPRPPMPRRPPPPPTRKCWGGSRGSPLQTPSPLPRPAPRAVSEC